MRVSRRIVGGLIVLALVLGSAAQAASWTEGRNYFLVTPPRPPAVAGKVEVTEAFSFACPACNLFVPVMDKLRRSLPPNAVVTYLPASFQPAEDWPMFQLAFYTAQALGVEERWHDAMFDAVWNTGELATFDGATQHIKDHLPTIEDAARFYNRRAGVPVDKFLSASKSFTVDAKVRNAEAAIAAYGVDRTPTIVVNGKYRLHVESAGGTDRLIELVKWLVAKETK